VCAPNLEPNDLTTTQATETARNITDATKPTSRNFYTLPQFCIVLITLWAFFPVLENGFVDWDDKIVVGNVAYQGLGWPQLRWMIAGFHFGQYQPLAWMTLGLDHVIWWTDPFGHHLTNLALHIVNAGLAYCIVLELLRHRSSDGGSRNAAWSRAAAAIGVLVFSLHPLRVESIAWAAARGELLAAAFFLLSLFGYLKGNGPGGVRGSARWTIFSICAFVVSLLAGPSGLVLPLILLIIDSYPLRRLADLRNRFGSSAGRVLWQKMPYLLASCVYIAVTLAARDYDPMVQPAHRDDFLTWTLHQVAAPAFYLWKTILPVGLSPAYELRDWSVAPYVAATLLVSASALVLRARYPVLAALWISYFALLVPVLRSEFPAQQSVADRHTYLAALPLALLIGAGVSQYANFATIRRLGKWPLVWGGALAIAAFAALGVLSWNQVRTWRDSETLWKNAVAVNPTSRAYFNLAILSEAQGKYDDAIAAHRRVVEIDSRRWDAHQRAAELLQKQGKMAEAVEHYRVVVQLNPNAIDAQENLAAGLVNQGDIGEAVQHFRKILGFAPERNQTRVKLGMVLAVQGLFGEAAEVLRAAAKADPKDGRILLQLGQVLAAQGKLNEAVDYFSEATRLRPEDAEAHESLGRGLSELGNKDEGAKHLREALRILRSSPAAR
jgi:tetratricopeptide (TPR) repeat protein